VPAHGVVLFKVSGTAPTLPGLGTNYLSDLQAAYGYVGWGTLIKDKSIGGNTLTLNGARYAKGLGVHAFSGVEYRLGGAAARFQADIGIDDEAGAGKGSVVFQVYADGTKVFDSGIMHGGDRHQSLDLDVTAVNRLTLGVNDADDGNNYDHADWAGARVTAASPALSILTSGAQIQLTWPGWATSYHAYSANSLGLPGQWSLLTNTAQSSAGTLNIGLPKTAQQQFFRLSAP
jgi:hypothetical protein